MFVVSAAQYILRLSLGVHFADIPIYHRFFDGHFFVGPKKPSSFTDIPAVFAVSKKKTIITCWWDFFNFSYFLLENTNQSYLQHRASVTQCVRHISYMIIAPAIMTAEKDQKKAAFKCFESVGLDPDSYRIGHTKARYFCFWINFIPFFCFLLLHHFLSICPSLSLFLSISSWTLSKDHPPEFDHDHEFLWIHRICPFYKQSLTPYRRALHFLLLKLSMFHPHFSWIIFLRICHSSDFCRPLIDYVCVCHLWDAIVCFLPMPALHQSAWHFINRIACSIRSTIYYLWI